jgi:hypothetical protein
MRARAGTALLLAIAAGTTLYVKAWRPWQLRWGATDEELARALPGDELVTTPTFNATRAISIAAPPERVWPWLVQVGSRRAGWYSYDLLDNLGHHRSTRRIIPELQQLTPGDESRERNLSAPKAGGYWFLGHDAEAREAIGTFPRELV